MKLTKKAEATRQQLLDSGHALVLRKGFVGVGLQELLTACNVPKGSFYHYFASKEAFGCALLEQYVADYGQRLQGLLAEHSSGRDRVMAYWQAWLGTAEHRGWAEDCLVVKLAAEVADLSEDMRRILNDGVSALVARIAAAVREGREDGSLPPGADAQALAQVLYQMWLGAALLAKLGRDRTPLHQALAATEHLLACNHRAPAVASPSPERTSK